MRNKKKSQISVLLLILLGLSIGFAALATTLKINGSATITKNTWNIYWDNIANQDGVTPTTSEIVSEDANHPNNIVTFEVTFDKPGDYYEFTVDAVNAGTLDAEILSIEKKYNDTVIPETGTSPLPSYLKYEVKYADDTLPAIGDGLAKAQDLTSNPPVYTTKTYKIRVEYDKDAVTNADINNQVGNVTHEFSFKVDYGQGAPASSPWTLPNGRTPETLQTGDELCLKSPTGLYDQCFNFIRYDENNDAVLLAKYNLNVGPKAKGTATGIQESDVIGETFDDAPDYGAVRFSPDTSYWWDSNPSLLKSKYGSSYPAYVYDHDLVTEPVFNVYPSGTVCNTNGFSIAYYVEPYKPLLETYGATIKEIRLLKLEEAEASGIGCSANNSRCPTDGFITNTSFWLGTAANRDHVYLVKTNGNFYRDTYILDGNNGDSIGVRPVIVVEKSNL